MVERKLMIAFEGWILSRALRLQRLTWRAHIEGREHLQHLYATGEAFLLCFWHGKYVPIFPLLEGYEALVISSLSKRGRLIAEICESFGYRSTLIPDQPTHDSLRLMEGILSRARAGAFAVDGPLGPRHRVKSGVIRIASTFGFRLLPASVGSRGKIVFDKRWDRLEIPLPFARVCLVIGEPITVSPGLRSKEVREWADNLGKIIERLDRKAEYVASRNGDQKEYPEDFNRL
ncbi:MAG: hypothetical protein JRI58_14165 [Deltaproteobacteria bacterium]|nr:hypothetical protein [Deltaproteobacteria bacterium]MBW1936662.1 hypothetical protein [Deltaproteobacteria bacterium]MBW2075862.1 hypothetical protein [Deltaproteobacteria bacterium]